MIGLDYGVGVSDVDCVELMHERELDLLKLYQLALSKACDASTAASSAKELSDVLADLKECRESLEAMPKVMMPSLCAGKNKEYSPRKVSAYLLIDPEQKRALAANCWANDSLRRAIDGLVLPLAPEAARLELRDKYAALMLENYNARIVIRDLLAATHDAASASLANDGILLYLEARDVWNGKMMGLGWSILSEEDVTYFRSPFQKGLVELVPALYHERRRVLAADCYGHEGLMQTLRNRYR